MILLNNVSFKYKNADKYALEKINLEVYDGEILFVVGKNGSGKSTLLKLIYGLIKPNNGEIKIDNISLKKKLSDCRKIMGICMQNPETQILFNKIDDELFYVLKEYNQELKEQIINESLSAVKMEKYRTADLFNLSLGQKQKIIIAETIAKKPKYILLDEPTSMVDAKSKEDIELLIKYLKQKGYTIVVSSNMADEMLLADRIVLLEEGKIQKIISKKELIDSVDYLRDKGIVTPKIIELISKLKKNKIDVELSEFDLDNLVTAIANKIVGDNNDK